MGGLVNHAFQPHSTWKRDECDKKVSDGGRPRLCGRPAREHEPQQDEGGYLVPEHLAERLREHLAGPVERYSFVLKIGPAAPPVSRRWDRLLRRYAAKHLGAEVVDYRSVHCIRFVRPELEDAQRAFHYLKRFGPLVYAGPVAADLEAMLEGDMCSWCGRRRAVGELRYTTCNELRCDDCCRCLDGLMS
jgi:hypothetical protein